MLKTTCAAIALFALNLSLAEPALAIGCANPIEAAALKTAVMQQEMMVAALQCHEAGAYNRFVTAYRPELMASDAALKAFFVRRGGEHGEAGYDTFKTKAANLSALEQARDAHAFCADAHALFAAAFANPGSLMSFVESRSSITDMGNVCLESRPSPLLTRTDADAVGGVPTYNLPSIPYRHADASPPPQPEGRMADTIPDQNQAEAAPAYANEDDAPPPRPRYYQIRNPGYYRYRPYGPPQDWRYDPAPPPPPRYGWYRDGYSNW